MIRKRSRVSSNKQIVMADHGSVSSPSDKHRKPTSFQRLFTGFTFKNFSEVSESSAIMSPTSILDSKPFSGFKNPFLPDQNNPTAKTQESDSRRTWDKLDSKGIGLGIVDALNFDDKSDSILPKPESRMVLFGSQLKIQVPPLPVSATDESPKSPADFGIKTRNSQFGSFSSGLSHSPVKKPACGSPNSGMDTSNSPRVFSGCLSATEMELSEDYTCVISYGPNPKTTHIFDDYIVESCSGVVEFSASRTETNNAFLGDGSSYPSENFLSFCHACKKQLGLGKDIYMYRGEKAFCSSECRYQEMLLEEEGIDNLDPEDIYGTCCS